MSASLVQHQASIPSEGPPTGFQKANLLMRMCNYEAATSLYAQVTADRPDFHPAWINHLRCLVKLGNSTHIVHVIERYLSIYGENIERVHDVLQLKIVCNNFDIRSIVLKNARIDPWVAYIVRQVSRTVGLERFQKLYELLEKDPSIYLTYHFLGDAFFEIGNFHNAEGWYNEAFVRNPASGVTALNLARCQIKIGTPFDLRLLTLRTANDLMSNSLNHREVLRSLAEHLACTRDIRSAAEHYLILADLEPDGDAILYAVEIFLKVGDISRALELSPIVKSWPYLEFHVWAKEYFEWATTALADESENVHLR